MRVGRHSATAETPRCHECPSIGSLKYSRVKVRDDCGNSNTAIFEAYLALLKVVFAPSLYRALMDVLKYDATSRLEP